MALNTISHKRFREQVFRKIYEITNGNMSEMIRSIDNIQELFPAEKAREVFNAVDFLISEGLLTGKKSTYISGNTDINLIYLTSEGIKFCEGTQEMSKSSHTINISGNKNSNIAIGDNNIQTIQTTESQLEDLLKLTDELLTHLPNDNDLNEIKALIKEQQSEGKPSASFLKSIGRQLLPFVMSVGVSVVSSGILTVLGI
jgi:hypothetical protein